MQDCPVPEKTPKENTATQLYAALDKAIADHGKALARGRETVMAASEDDVWGQFRVTYKSRKQGEMSDDNKRRTFERVLSREMKDRRIGRRGAGRTAFLWRAANEPSAQVVEE
jgi:hypothetical protein